MQFKASTFRFLALASLDLSFFSSSVPLPPPLLLPQTRRLPYSLRSLIPTRSPRCHCCFPSHWQSLTLWRERSEVRKATQSKCDLKAVGIHIVHGVLWQTKQLDWVRRLRVKLFYHQKESRSSKPERRSNFYYSVYYWCLRHFFPPEARKKKKR